MRTHICLSALCALAVDASAQVRYWVAVHVDDGPNELRLYDGPNFWSTREQYTGAAEDPIGFRDGAADLLDHYYFGWSGGVVRYGVSWVPGTLIISGPPPGFGVWRALAFDPSGDNGRGSLWAASYDSPLIRVDLSGNLLRSFPNPGVSFLALAYDKQNQRLWALTEGGYLSRLSTDDGSVLETLPPLAPNVMGWVGLSAFNDPEDGLLAIGDGKVYTSSDPPTGPWELPPGAYTGIALDYDRCAGISFCGDANCSGTQDAEDIDPFFLALGDPEAWAQQYPGCPLLCTCDANCDGRVDAEDIDAFFLQKFCTCF